MFEWLLYKCIRHRTATVSYKGRRIKLLIASSFAEQAVGLMYRKGLDKDQGMLFVFGRPSRLGIWMRNMRFSIDILWLDKDGRVVDIKKSAQPCSSVFNCEIYKPKRDSSYVLEMVAEASARYGIKIGDLFPLPR